MPPDLRLALANGQGERNGTSGLERTSSTPRVLPALLVSFVYLPPFQFNRPRYAFRDWVLDSGAFSAFASGTVIDLAQYIDTCRALLATDPQLTEVFALDVIGDHLASRRNCEAMWKAGVPAIPCYHRGEPEAELLSMARDYPKLALGGVARLRGPEKLRWAEQCFARVWPKRIHGFGFGRTTAPVALGGRDQLGARAVPLRELETLRQDVGARELSEPPLRGGVPPRTRSEGAGQVADPHDRARRAPRRRPRAPSRARGEANPLRAPALRYGVREGGRHMTVIFLVLVSLLGVILLIARARKG
jgi:hypothetical protein